MIKETSNGDGDGLQPELPLAKVPEETAVESTRVHVLPAKPTGLLHKRMDTSFLQYASYVIRDRAMILRRA